jgi:flagellar biosynthetic protein FliR
MMSVFDPVTQLQTPIIGNLMFMVMCVLMVQAGGMNALLAALFYSYDVLPPGTAVIISNKYLAEDVLSLISNFMSASFSMSIPMIGAILIVDVAMGMLVKAVPQMNVFVVGMPIKLLVGLVLLYMLTPALSDVYQMVMGEAYSAVESILQVMRHG